MIHPDSIEVKKKAICVEGGEIVEDKQDVVLAVKLSGADEAIKKAEQLIEKIHEARTLAGELASMLGKLEIKL